MDMTHLSTSFAAPLTPELILFLMMASTMVGSALCVVLLKNPVHSVLFLILAFLNASGLFILQGAEFVAMILAIVYVGAVAILFLFVVMMFDVDYREMKAHTSSYILFGSGVVGLLLVELCAGFFLSKLNVVIIPAIAQKTVKATATMTNTEALGHVLYTEYFVDFQLAGVVLLVAMIGAIVLTLRTKSKMRHQDAAAQMMRSPKNTLRLEKVPFRKGVRL